MIIIGHDDGTEKLDRSGDWRRIRADFGEPAKQRFTINRELGFTTVLVSAASHVGSSKRDSEFGPEDAVCTRGRNIGRGCTSVLGGTVEHERQASDSDDGEKAAYHFDQSDNVNDHRAAAIDLQAEKPARPAAPCASYCYQAFGSLPKCLSVILACAQYSGVTVHQNQLGLGG